MSLLKSFLGPCWRLIGVSLMAVTLTACFRPMLADRSVSGAPSVVRSLGDIYIEALAGRVGQKLRNELIFAFAGVNQTPSAPYRLTISLDESVTTGLVQPSTEALARTVKLTANYTLTDSATGKPIHGGSSFSRATFDKVRTPIAGGAALFANERAQRDAEDRAATSLAEDIRIRIAAYFASR